MMPERKTIHQAAIIIGIMKGESTIAIVTTIILTQITEMESITTKDFLTLIKTSMESRIAIKTGSMNPIINIIGNMRKGKPEII